MSDVPSFSQKIYETVSYLYGQNNENYVQKQTITTEPRTNKKKKKLILQCFASLFEREIQNLYTVFNFLYPAVIIRYAFTSLINEFIY